MQKLCECVNRKMLWLSIFTQNFIHFYYNVCFAPEESALSEGFRESKEKYFQAWFAFLISQIIISFNLCEWLPKRILGMH